MIDDQARALLIVGALLSGASGSAGFVGGRMTAPVADPELRFVHVPVPAISLPAVAPIDPAQPAAAAEPEPAAAPPADADPKPLPRPRPKADAKPKSPPKHEPARRPRKALPSCAFVKQRYEALSWPERMAAYKSASPEQIAHGKRCLGL